MPETPYEILDGRLLHVPPSDVPHASRHAKVIALLEALARTGWDVAADLLTRTSEDTDIAPDVSVRRVGTDPKTGGRFLEELAFEIVSTSRLSATGRKAARLSARGVRRIFAIDVRRERALEWSPETAGWRMLPPDGAIDDTILVMPLPLSALVGAASSDDLVARALLVKDNPVLRAELKKKRGEAYARGRAEGRAEGMVEARRDVLLRLLDERDERLAPATRRRIASCTDLGQLDAWIALAARGKPPSSSRPSKRRRRPV
jgi:hypothetical protein